MYSYLSVVYVVFFKQKTAYEVRISDWSSDVCSSDLAVDMNAVFSQRDAPGGEPAHGFHQQRVLALEHPRGEGVGIVAREHPHACLRDHRAAVEVGGDEVDAGAVVGGGGVKRLLVGGQAFEFRQQRGMDVDDPAGAGGEHRGEDQGTRAGGEVGEGGGE